LQLFYSPKFKFQIGIFLLMIAIKWSISPRSTNWQMKILGQNKMAIGKGIFNSEVQQKTKWKNSKANLNG
jgi:hypothetical protein